MTNSHYDFLNRLFRIGEPYALRIIANAIDRRRLSWGGDRANREPGATIHAQYGAAYSSLRALADSIDAAHVAAGRAQ